MARANAFSGVAYDFAITASIRAAGAEVGAAMAAASVSRTSDAGQTDFTTVNYNGTLNTLQAWEVWDILGGALKVRFEYWAAQTAGKAGKMKFIVGTGTDGSGNITGTIHTSVIQGTAADLIAGSKPSFVSNPATNDFFGFVYKIGGQVTTGAVGPAIGSICVEKIADATGTPDGSGYVITDYSAPAGSGGLTGTRKSVNAGGGTYTSGPATSICLVPHGLLDSSVGADKQVFLHQFPTPRIKFGLGVCTVIASEFPVNTTFNACLIGDPATKTRGYVSVANGLGAPAAHAVSASWSNAILWEP